MEAPTLGHLVLKWMRNNLLAPDRTDGSLFEPTPEQAEFALQFYRLDNEGRRAIRRGVLSRSKGWGKSPWLAALAIVEGLGPVLFDRWAEEDGIAPLGGGLYTKVKKGDPIGKPWSDVRTPLVQVSAVSGDQTQNCWVPLLEMTAEGAPIREHYPGLTPMETFIALPHKGRIVFVTASSRSREGNPAVFCVMDQTETWVPGNGGVKLAATMRRNLGKTGGASIESPNAYLPGEGSVAEESAKYWESIEDGKAKDDGLLYDHREAPADTDLSDRDSLLAGLAVAYGDSTWVDLDRIVAEIWDPATDPQDARRYYLNQVTHASDAYISQPEWKGCENPRELEDGELITLGFDGSRGKAKGKPDASALIGCAVTDGFTFEIGVWETEELPGMEEWQPPLPEIDAAVDGAFTRFDVVAFYADPAKDWRSKVNEWEAKYSGKVKVKAMRDHPFEWWMTGGRSVFIQRAVEAFAAGVRNKELRHAGTYRLTQHVLNARRRVRHQKLTLGKAHDYSPYKIDACVAAVLAWQARMDAIAAGVSARPKRRAPIRVR